MTGKQIPVLMSEASHLMMMTMILAAAVAELTEAVMLEPLEMIVVELETVEAP